MIELILPDGLLPCLLCKGSGGYVATANDRGSFRWARCSACGGAGLAPLVHDAPAPVKNPPFGQFYAPIPADIDLDEGGG